MKLSFFFFVGCVLILFGAFGTGISDAKGKGIQPADPVVSNKQVLADTFRNLVRYALLKTKRDVEKLGVKPSNFSVKAMDESLAAHSNAEIFGKGAMSLTRLLEKAHEQSLTFHFFWNAPASREPLGATFGFSYEPDGDLKVMLLWLDLPEQIPISPRVGVVDGHRPLDEAVAELLRFHGDGRLAPYPPPK